MKDLEKLLKTDYKACVLLDAHIGHLSSIMELLRNHNIDVFVHIDLIKGISHDEYACEYIVQQYKPKGVVSTKSKVIKKAKSLKTTTILRVFIIDSYALDRSVKMIKQVAPDYVEVLPGVATKVIAEIREKTGVNVIAGGLISKEAEVAQAISSGAYYVTTSDRHLW